MRMERLTRAHGSIVPCARVYPPTYVYSSTKLTDMPPTYIILLHMFRMLFNDHEFPKS